MKYLLLSLIFLIVISSSYGQWADPRLVNRNQVEVQREFQAELAKNRAEEDVCNRDIPKNWRKEEDRWCSAYAYTDAAARLCRCESFRTTEENKIFRLRGKALRNCTELLPEHCKTTEWLSEIEQIRSKRRNSDK